VSSRAENDKCTNSFRSKVDVHDRKRLSYYYATAASGVALDDA
jgi:hypothetical protein